MNKEASREPIVSCTALSELLYVVGHVAVKQMIHLDVSIYKELKRRNAVREMRGKSKKHASKSVASTPNIRGKAANRSTISNTPLQRQNSMLSVTSEDNGEEALEGATDDAEAEFVNGALENEIVTGDGLLAKFVYAFELIAIMRTSSAELSILIETRNAYMIIAVRWCWMSANIPTSIITKMCKRLVRSRSAR